MAEHKRKLCPICGEWIGKYNKMGKLRKFKHGHNARKI